MMQGVTKRSEKAGDVDLVEWPEPVARPDHVVLEVAAAGICGTDLHIYRNEYNVKPPVVMGHEVCGRVVQTGEGVDKALIGALCCRNLLFNLRNLSLLPEREAQSLSRSSLHRKPR